MRLLIRYGKHSDLIRRLALELLQHVPGKDICGEISTLFEFVRSNIRFVWDPTGIEKLCTAEQVIADGAGDCDDMVILLGALLESIGHRTRVFAMGFRPGELTHVVLQARVRDSWVTLDPTEPYPAGWTPPGIKQTMAIDNGD